MWCFTVFKSKKKIPENTVHRKPVNPQEHAPITFPKPQMVTRSLQSSSPQPLPLPSPQRAATLKTMGIFQAGNASVPIYAFAPLPLPPTGTRTLRTFSYEDVAAACHNFSSNRCMSEGLSSVMYKASFRDDASSSKKFEATVRRLNKSTQCLEEFINEVNTIASFQHPNLCKLLGYHAHDGTEQRMLIYERLSRGSLNQLLYGRSDGPPIDWNTRMKIALCAAQGLSFLHEDGPFQPMFNEFSTANIQIDKDFSAKLSGYGCVGRISETEISSVFWRHSIAAANLPVETLERGLLTRKSNVWSFGIVLLELLTGRKNLDSRKPKEEVNLVKWSRPFLADDVRLSMIMDPQLRWRFPAKAARTVADIAQRCLQKDPIERPTMRTIVEHLKTIQDVKYTWRYPLQEPPVTAGKHLSKPPSLNGIIMPPPRLSFSPSLSQESISPTRSVGLLSSLPLRDCSSTISLVELERQESRRSMMPEHRLKMMNAEKKVVTVKKQGMKNVEEQSIRQSQR